MSTQADRHPVQSTRRPVTGVLAGAVILAVFAVVAGFQLADGHVYVDAYPADTVFVFDIILRIVAGQVPHVDFTLHLGSLPYVLAALTGAPDVGSSFLVAQTVFTGFCLLIGLWTWRTRLTAVSGPLLLLCILILGQTLALPTLHELSPGLFYNRWSWALTLLFACQVLLPARNGTARGLDGALTGLIAFALLTTKVTFFVGLLPAALLCTLWRGQFREIGWGLAVFAGLMLAVFVIEPGFWPGYVENIAWAADNPLRPKAGKDLVTLLSGRAFLGYTLVFGVFLFAVARTQGRAEVLWLAVAAVGFYFIQYQNYLNAPFWVLFLAVYAVTQAGALGGAGRCIWSILSLAFVVFGATLLGPMTNGLLPTALRSSDPVYVPYPPDGRVALGARFLEMRVAPFVTENGLALDETPPWTGESECVIMGGRGDSFLKIADIVADLPGPAFVADSISPYWFLSGTAPLPGAALWNYGSVRGLENAAFVIVPICAQKPYFKREILREIARQGVRLTPYTETERAAVYRKAD